MSTLGKKAVVKQNHCNVWLQRGKVVQGKVTKINIKNSIFVIFELKTNNNRGINV